ncbi:MAG TPA: hypothetical protein VHZ73_03335 [Vicinamibacterales bacterium]|jgi:hypothetical protein|nr:hypothetical protein [Vicinamibacterales bacterium]
MNRRPVNAAVRCSIGTWVALIIATLVLMPSLVRATQSLRHDTPCIRLNRGFNSPESKCRVQPPSPPVAAPIVIVSAVPAVVLSQPGAISLVETQHDTPPAVLRGPPPLSIIS